MYKKILLALAGVFLLATLALFAKPASQAGMSTEELAALDAEVELTRGMSVQERKAYFDAKARRVILRGQREFLAKLNAATPDEAMRMIEGARGEWVRFIMTQELEQAIKQGEAQGVK